MGFVISILLTYLLHTTYTVPNTYIRTSNNVVLSMNVRISIGVFLLLVHKYVIIYVTLSTSKVRTIRIPYVKR